MAPSLIFAIIISLIGGIVFAAFDGKASEIGKSVMWAGVFATVGLVCKVFGR